MAKVKAIASEDFFDRANQQIKKAGRVYDVHESHAKDMGMDIIKSEPEQTKAQKKAASKAVAVKKAAPRKAK